MPFPDPTSTWDIRLVVSSLPPCREHGRAPPTPSLYSSVLSPPPPPHVCHRASSFRMAGDGEGRSPACAFCCASKCPKCSDASNVPNALNAPSRPRRPPHAARLHTAYVRGAGAVDGPRLSRSTPWTWSFGAVLTSTARTQLPGSWMSNCPLTVFLFSSSLPLPVPAVRSPRSPPYQTVVGLINGPRPLSCQGGRQWNGTGTGAA